MGKNEFKPSDRLMAKIMEDMGKIHGITPLEPLPTAPSTSTSDRPQGSRIPPPRKAKANAPNYAANPLKPAPKRKSKPKRKRSKDDDADTDSANTDDQRESLIKSAKASFKPSKKKRTSKSPGNIKAFFKPVPPRTEVACPPPVDLLSPISSPKSNPFLTLRDTPTPDPVQLALQEAGLLDLQNCDAPTPVNIFYLKNKKEHTYPCLLYTSPSPRD